MNNLVIIKEQNYTKLPKLFLFPENPLPPHKGDRGGLERRKALAALVLFVGCWYYLQKSERFTPPTAQRMAPSRFARLWAFGRRAQAIHHQAVYRYDTVAVEKSRQNRTIRRPCQISPTEKELTIPFFYNTEIFFCVTSRYVTQKNAIVFSWKT